VVSFFVFLAGVEVYGFGVTLLVRHLKRAESFVIDIMTVNEKCSSLWAFGRHINGPFDSVNFHSGSPFIELTHCCSQAAAAIG
jgi:hypothetical protein